MSHRRTIKKLVKEKDRLANIKKSVSNPFSSTPSECEGKARALIQEAINHLHEAEMWLRTYDGL